jgi:hypothetical protein
MRVNPWVNHDRLDDEVIAINLNGGAYFAFDGAAADAWTLLAAGHGAEAIGDELARRYEVDAATAAADVAGFAEELVAQSLFDRTDAPAAAPDIAGLLAPRDEPLDYVRPTTEPYEDLADLLKLDPIHEVDPTGWPVGRQDEAS